MKYTLLDKHCLFIDDDSRFCSFGVLQVCLDLVCNAHIHRRRHPEVEVFARFLEEFYGEKELYFFLYGIGTSTERQTVHEHRYLLF